MAVQVATRELHVEIATRQLALLERLAGNPASERTLEGKISSELQLLYASKLQIAFEIVDQEVKPPLFDEVHSALSEARRALDSLSELPLQTPPHTLCALEAWLAREQTTRDRIDSSVLEFLSLGRWPENLSAEEKAFVAARIDTAADWTIGATHFLIQAPSGEPQPLLALLTSLLVGAWRTWVNTWALQLAGLEQAFQEGYLQRPHRLN